MVRDLIRSGAATTSLPLLNKNEEQLHFFSKMKATGVENREEISSYKSVAYESPGSKYVVPVGSFHVKAIFLFFFAVLPVAVSMFGSGYLENCQIHLPKQVQTVYAAQTSAPTTTTKKPSWTFTGRRRRSTVADEEEVLSSINLCERKG